MDNIKNIHFFKWARRFVNFVSTEEVKMNWRNDWTIKKNTVFNFIQFPTITGIYFLDIIASLSWWISLFYIINSFFFFLLKNITRMRIIYLRTEAFVFTSNAARVSQKVGHPWSRQYIDTKHKNFFFQT